MKVIGNLLKGNARTVKARKNVLASIALKGIDGIAYLLFVPVTLGYLKPYEYGVWLTLNSILIWIDSFDIGLGNGMRNKLAEAIACDDKERARSYVSTTFFMLALLMAVMVVIGTAARPWIDWYAILHTAPEEVGNLGEIVYLSFLIYCLNFIFKFIGNVYLAVQLPAVNNFFVTAGHLLALIVIFILTKTTSGSLLLVAVVYCASPLLIYLLAYPVTFFKIFPYLRPEIRSFRRKYLSDLFNIGILFFILQLSGILLFSLANLLISHLFGPEKVTPYNVAYRYYSLVPMLMTIIVAPMWSATTDAYTRGEIDWIRSTMRRIRKILLLALAALAVMTAMSEWVYSIWVGKEVAIGLPISFWMAAYTAILTASLTYSNFLNGLGKLRIQTFNTVTVALLFYPVCYFLGMRMEVPGVLIGMCLLNLSGLILNMIQFHKVINGKAKGIWAR
ncbi:MAG: MATE family efflux transporter [Muribaculaceae bacterium]|nr:MATE family efflux transporter [Muribaculaceae bacterium]MDE6027242.1 MATE family efflux transporter [Muribaculaceae bacterium]